MIINEELARRNKENHSFSDYVPGSATKEYNQAITEAKERIERAKSNASPEAKERLDRLYQRFCFKYANWINAYNANGARHVSWFIAGPSNYNLKAHERYLARESKLWEEYDYIKNMIDRGISQILNGDRVIKSDNPKAIELLKEKIAQLEKNQELMKAANKIIRSKLDQSAKIDKLIEIGFTKDQAEKLFVPNCFGEIGFAGFQLTNNNANIRRLKQRLAVLEKKAQDSTTERMIGKVKIIDNVEINRLQLFFPDKPSEEIRHKLKSAGFRWTPSLGCWQRYRSARAMYEAEQILFSI